MNGAAKKIRLIAFDVDGTLTDGSLYLTAEGEAVKCFHAQDGLGISLAHRMGYQVGFITGRSSDTVHHRAKELHCDFCLMDVKDKVAAMEGLLAERGLSWKETAYMGDDLNDLPLLIKVGFGGAPKDGVKEVRKAASFISKHKGGRGAARDFIEEILKAQGKWKEAVHSYFQSPKDAQQ